MFGHVRQIVYCKLIIECFFFEKHRIIIPLNNRSRDGLGRSCVVGATLMLQTNDNLTYAEAFDAIKKVIGPRAIQTVKVPK